MTATNGLGILVLIVLFDLGLMALVVLCKAIFPGWLGRAQTNVQQHSIRSFIVGLVNLVFFGVISFALLQGPDVVRLAGLLVTTGLLAAVSFGIAACAQFVGMRIQPDSTSATRSLLLGTLTLELAALVPLVGWILVPLFTVLIGLGAAIIGLVWRGVPKTGRDPSEI
ncbi:MAG: hypothetical protein WCF84_11700 [Anaerolineae bacterium]